MCDSLKKIVQASTLAGAPRQGKADKAPSQVRYKRAAPRWTKRLFRRNTGVPPHHVPNAKFFICLGCNLEFTRPTQNQTPQFPNSSPIPMISTPQISPNYSSSSFNLPLTPSPSTIKLFQPFLSPSPTIIQSFLTLFSSLFSNLSSPQLTTT